MANLFEKKPPAHRWNFFRAGGFDQVLLETGEDFRSLDQLDPKLWVALACPAKGLEFDTRTLELIDTDGDGRIRVPEILSAVRWACSVLKDAGELARGGASLPLAAIDDSNPEGARLLASARQILANLGKGEADAISLDDLADPARIFAHTVFNGDGIVPAEAGATPEEKALIQDIMACLGSDTDRSGAPGVSQARVDQFFAEAQAYEQWRAKAEADAAMILPLGDATADVAQTFGAVKAKVDDYFTRCRLAAFDARAAGPLNRAEAEYAALAGKVLSPAEEDLAGFPLAQVAAGKPLPLQEGLNPAWAEAVGRLRDQVVKPLLGARAELTLEEWKGLSAKFAAHEAWLAAKAGSAVEKLGLARVREILAGKGKDALAALIGKDLALEAEANAVASVERLVRYHRDLHTLLNNFVAFRDFYARRGKAVFQAGVLYLDGRSCELCLRVDDEAKHGALAGLSRAYLAYCACTRKGSAEKMTIVAAFTGGDSDFLMVGRNGVFYDRKGQDWDATITKVVENPISIRQAFWSPYKRVGKMIGEQIEKLAASKEKAVQDQAAAGVAGAGAAVEASKPAAPAAFDIGKFAGVFAAIGLALGAIGTAIAALVTGLLNLAWWQIPLAFAGVLLVISGPSMIIAALKLRQRNLGPLLDASGWAVNARAMLNIPFGGALTSIATLPEGAKRSLSDPYAQKKQPWGLYLFLLILLAAGAWAVYRFYGEALGLR
ncbi:MAG: hypothetical protein AB1578_10375 [Thermodesulfobacteriota bacterium]